MALQYYYSKLDYPVSHPNTIFCHPPPPPPTPLSISFPTWELVRHLTGSHHVREQPFNNDVTNVIFPQRSDYLRREVLKMIRNFPNAAVAPRSLATIWGGASLLKMLLKCMEDLMAKKDWKWDFFINLSESDYPIK